MRKLLTITSVCCVLSLACPPTASRGADLNANAVQGGGACWTDAIWKTNGTTTPLVGPPVAGNTYTYLPNTIPWGNNLACARTRSSITNATTLITFLGDSLTLTTNTELRTKNITKPASLGAPTMNFPGVGGNPGLILDGGVLNVGDDGVPVITGKIQAAGTSFICPGDNGAGTAKRPNRAYTIAGQLTGSGSLVILQTPTNLAQTISGTGNTFSGQWFVKAGRLLGATPESLGTNSITIDPQLFPPPPIDPTVAATNGWFAGPAVLEVNYPLNSAGVLTLTNGGKMRLHQSTVFSAAYIEGTPLGLGTHYYAELLANFPDNFEAGGAGAITIQPYGAPPSLGPTITTQPMPQMLLAGATARFTVAASPNGAPPLTYHWQRNGTNLIDSGNITGSTNTMLVVANVSAADAVEYDVVVGNTAGYTTSSIVALTLVSASGEPYEGAVLAAGPVAFYQLNETGDPATNNSPAFDLAGGYAGAYGNTVQNGNPAYNIAGPGAGDGFPGFAAGNTAALFANASSGAKIGVLPWNLNTNTVTITAWINPYGGQVNNSGLVYCRGGHTVVGLGYNNAGGLNYNWNNEQPVTSWDSGLIPPQYQWSMVALVVTPTNATIYLFNAGGLTASSHAYTHVNQGFEGLTQIGDDSADGGNGARAFNGIIDDVAVFNKALTQNQLLGLYAAASGVSSFAPAIAAQPVSQTLYQTQTAQFTVLAIGSDVLTYQWQAGITGSGIYTNVADGGQFSGSATPTLTIRSIDMPNALDYIVWVTNSAGAITSTPPATLTVLATNAAENITLLVQESGSDDWETGANWSDGNPASISAVAKPGSTYEVLPGTRLRSPVNQPVATFPGQVLTVDGDGVWVLSTGTGATIGEIRFKQPTYDLVNGQVVFPKLRMNGGQFDTGNGGMVVIGGEMDILANTPFSNNSSSDRGYRVDAWLTGSGSVEYHGYDQGAFMTGYSNNLNIACASNTFSGEWKVVTGTLLGTGMNSLGTNNILVGTNGALETTYNIGNSNAVLTLNGRVFLHQDDTFKSVLINGVSVAPGTYSFAALNAAYPGNFPATWTPQVGAENFSTGSGSITVLAHSRPVITLQPVSQSLYEQQTAHFSVSAVGNLPLYSQWLAGPVGSGVYTNLSDGGKFSGTTTTDLTIANIGPENGLDYICVVTNASGSATSSVATLTVLGILPAENITLNYGGSPIVQQKDTSWETEYNWSDGLPASVSAAQKPGSTYEVVPGARLRPPTDSYVTFPGVQLTVDGDGVWVNDNGPTIGELRFKHSSEATNYFKKLVMNGGQLDQGDSSLIVIAGEMDILANTPIYVNSSAGQDRSYRIDAWLTGTAGIEWHQYGSSFSGNLNISGTSNTFSGQWHVVTGVLLGSGTNSLGTNSITVEAGGALETLYDVHNHSANLLLNGQMFLHQNDTFWSVVVGGQALPTGTYSYAQLAAAFPTYFPSSWPQQTGSAFSTASGSLTVLGAPPGVLSYQFSGSSLQLSWSSGTLLEATNVSGPWTTNAAPSPYTVPLTEPQKFFRVQLP